MIKILQLSEAQRQMVIHWLPALAAGVLAGVVFITLGRTPFMRALALAATITVVAATLLRFGSLLALIGSLALAFSPAFWTQTGGGVPAALSTITALLIVAGLAGQVMIRLSNRPIVGLALGIIVFTVLFWWLGGATRSLRLTTFFSASLFYLLIDGLFTANPRPDESEPAPLHAYHIWGMLICFGLGVLNDPLFTLTAPGLMLGLVVSKTRLPFWYWLITGVILSIGLRGIVVEYLNSTWWVYPAAVAEANGLRVPYMMADGWREGSRWLMLLNLMAGQFTVLGVVLGVVGLARLSRWYPPLGVVTMVAYGGYALFGLVYFGSNNAVLLLPMFMIQVVWMTYAVYTFSQWLQKSFQSRAGIVRWAAPALFTLLPFAMLIRITSTL